MSDMPVIESGIPIPVVHHLSRWPFGVMKVGESFRVPMEDAKRMRTAACMYSKRHCVVFRTRRTINGVMCWRVA